MTTREYLYSRDSNEVRFCKDIAVIARCNFTAADRILIGVHEPFLSLGVIDTFEGFCRKCAAARTVIDMNVADK